VKKGTSFSTGFRMESEVTPQGCYNLEHAVLIS